MFARLMYLSMAFRRKVQNQLTLSYSADSDYLVYALNSANYTIGEQAILLEEYERKFTYPSTLRVVQLEKQLYKVREVAYRREYDIVFISDSHDRLRAQYLLLLQEKNAVQRSLRESAGVCSTEVHDYTDLVEQLKYQIRELTQAKAELTGEQKANLAQIRSLKKQIDEDQLVQRDSLDETQRNKAEIAALQSQLSKIQSDFTQQKAELDLQIQQNSDLEIKLQAQTNRNEQLTQQLAYCTSYLTSYNDVLNQSSSKLEQEYHRFDELDRQLKLKGQEIEFMKEQQTTTARQISALNEKAVKLNERILAKQQAFLEIRSKLGSLVYYLQIIQSTVHDQSELFYRILSNPYQNFAQADNDADIVQQYNADHPQNDLDDLYPVQYDVYQIEYYQSFDNEMKDPSENADDAPNGLTADISDDFENEQQSPQDSFDSEPGTEGKGAEAEEKAVDKPFDDYFDEQPVEQQKYENSFSASESLQKKADSQHAEPSNADRSAEQDFSDDQAVSAHTSNYQSDYSKEMLDYQVIAEDYQPVVEQDKEPSNSQSDNTFEDEDKASDIQAQQQNVEEVKEDLEDVNVTYPNYVSEPDAYQFEPDEPANEPEINLDNVENALSDDYKLQLGDNEAADKQNSSYQDDFEPSAEHVPVSYYESSSEKSVAENLGIQAKDDSGLYPEAELVVPDVDYYENETDNMGSGFSYSAYDYEKSNYDVAEYQEALSYGERSVSINGKQAEPVEDSNQFSSQYQEKIEYNYTEMREQEVYEDFSEEEQSVYQLEQSYEEYDDNKDQAQYELVDPVYNSYPDDAEASSESEAKLEQSTSAKQEVNESQSYEYPEGDYVETVPSEGIAEQANESYQVHNDDQPENPASHASSYRQSVQQENGSFKSGSASNHSIHSSAAPDIYLSDQEPSEAPSSQDHALEDNEIDDAYDLPVEDNDSQQKNIKSNENYVDVSESYEKADEFAHEQILPTNDIVEQASEHDEQQEMDPDVQLAPESEYNPEQPPDTIEISQDEALAVAKENSNLEQELPDTQNEGASISESLKDDRIIEEDAVPLYDAYPELQTEEYERSASENSAAQME